MIRPKVALTIRSVQGKPAIQREMKRPKLALWHQYTVPNETPDILSSKHLIRLLKTVS